MKSVFLCILLNENYCLKANLMETKFIHRVMHVCSEFLLKISDRKKYFPCFLTTQIDQTVESTPKRVWNFLNFNLKRNRSRRKSFAVEKQIKLYITTNFGSFFFPCKFLCWMKRYSCYWYLSQWKGKLFVTFVIARVPSSPVPA